MLKGNTLKDRYETPTTTILKQRNKLLLLLLLFSLILFLLFRFSYPGSSKRKSYILISLLGDPHCLFTFEFNLSTIRTDVRT